MQELYLKGPHLIHPEKPSAVGSRNSLNRGNRDEYLESQVVIDEEVDKVINHINSKLPPEVLEKLDVQGNVKELLHNYYNQSFQNMLNRYLTTVEDELGKKYRDLIDRDEAKNLARYTPKLLAELLEGIGGFDKFHTGEIEKSVVNMYGHLQGAVQRRMSDLEVETNSLLRRKSDVGALVRGENAYAIAKCSIRDNPIRPETVYDAVLAVNVLDSELISPIVHVQSLASRLLRELTSEYVLEKIDKDIQEINDRLLDQGKEEMGANEIIFERIKRLEEHFSGEKDNPNDVRYSLMAKTIYDSVGDLADTISMDDYDPLRLRENVKYILDDINVRNRGYNSAVNAITRVLDLSRMSYQHIENLKNRRSCVVREYAPTTEESPDENFIIHLDYYDMPQLKGMREAYASQFDEFAGQVDDFSKIVDGIYSDFKKTSGYIDFDDLRSEYIKEDAVDLSSRLWNEITFVVPEKTSIEEDHNTYDYDVDFLKKKIVLISQRIALIYGNTYPTQREVLEARLDTIANRFQDFAKCVNPYQVQPGILLTIELTTIKRKQVTLFRMANVLNEFLYHISMGFSDPAFATFSRRRSTVRSEEENQYFMYNKSDEVVTKTQLVKS